MASPFELATPRLSDTVHRRREEFKNRSNTRRTVIEQRMNPRRDPKRDVIWQRNPDRVLKYRPSHLHYYGWFPIIVLRNWKATVFGEVYIHAQTVMLLLWMALLHTTGLGVPDADLGTLVAMFGTPYLGAIFNYGMVVVFILGLFITLVINRWATIRGSYTKLMGTTTDLCMMVASTVQNAEDPNDKRASRARTEITRLLNLGHLLIISKADAQNGEFKKSYGVRTVYRSAASSFKRLFVDEILSTKFSNQSGSPRYTQALSKPRNLDSFDTMVKEGLMNPDEWKILKEGEGEGVPDYQLVYYWAQSLVNKCRAAEWVISAPQMVPLMLNKINGIVEAGSSILSTIDSQMPYPYVHLVSFVVHMYLIVLATWFGCFLHTGRLGETFVIDTGNIEGGYAIKSGDAVRTSIWMVFWCYTLMAVANFTFQGLLDMHTLLDNPFGNHCAKFPLRANVGAVLNASRAMLTFADRTPAAFEDVFQQNYADVENTTSFAPSQSLQQQADFMNPTSTGQFPMGSLASLHGDINLGRPSKHREKKQEKQEGILTGTSEHKTTPYEAQTSNPPLSRFSGHPLADTQGDRASHVEREDAPRMPSGDFAIQERYLQGAVRHTIDALTNTDSRNADQV